MGQNESRVNDIHRPDSIKILRESITSEADAQEIQFSDDPPQGVNTRGELHGVHKQCRHSSTQCTNNNNNLRSNAVFPFPSEKQLPFCETYPHYADAELISKTKLGDHHWKCSHSRQSKFSRVRYPRNTVLNCGTMNSNERAKNVVGSPTSSSNRSRKGLPPIYGHSRVSTLEDIERQSTHLIQRQTLPTTLRKSTDEDKCIFDVNHRKHSEEICRKGKKNNALLVNMAPSVSSLYVDKETRAHSDAFINCLREVNVIANTLEKIDKDLKLLPTKISNSFNVINDFDILAEIESKSQKEVIIAIKNGRATIQDILPMFQKHGEIVHSVQTFLIRLHSSLETYSKALYHMYHKVEDNLVNPNESKIVRKRSPFSSFFNKKKWNP